MPANDKEAHVPIWFTLQIGGAEAPTVCTPSGWQVFLDTP